MIPVRFHAEFIKWQSRRAAARISSLYPDRTVLEVGAGSGWLTKELRAVGCMVVSTDYPEVDAHDMKSIPDNSTGLIVCSNTVEHLHHPARAFKEFHRVAPKLWLTWTPFWSPFGGHSFSPLHYFGVRSGGGDTVNANLYITTVAETLRQLDEAGWRVVKIYPRYWPWFGFLARWKLTREWATWNVEIYAIRKEKWSNLHGSDDLTPLQSIMLRAMCALMVIFGLLCVIAPFALVWLVVWWITKG